MDEEVIHRLARFKLKGREEEGIALEHKDVDVDVSKEECENSLVGRM